MSAEASAGDDLKLAADAKTPRRKRAHPYEHYSAIYGTSVRALKHWNSWGSAATPPEEPPFDDPEAMVIWWPRHSKHRVPQKLLAAAANARARRTAGAALPSAPPAPGSQAASAGEPPPAPLPAQVAVVDINAIEGIDLVSAAGRLRQILAGNLRLLEQALADPNSNESTRVMLAKRVDEAMERLRKIDDSLVDQEKKRGDLIPRAELRSELGNLLTSLATSLVPEITDHLGIDRARAVLFADAWFRRLRNSRFTSDITPQLTPAEPAA